MFLLWENLLNLQKPFWIKFQWKIDEEKEIAKLSEKIDEDSEFPNEFIELEKFSKEITSKYF